MTATETETIATPEQTDEERTKAAYQAEIDSLPFDFDEQDTVTKAIGEQVLMGLVKIKFANELLFEDNRTSSSDIDKALKEYKGDNNDLLVLIAQRTEAEKVAKAAKEAVQNYYRVNVLGEEEVASSDVNVEEVRASRTVVLQALTALKGFATINNNDDVLGWIEKLQIPMVGREGTSMIGKKRARVLVTIGTTIYSSFGEAAKALSNDESVEGEVTSTDLNMAWSESSEAPEFEFRGKQIKVQPKPTKAETEAAVDSNGNAAPVDDEADDVIEDDDASVDSDAEVQ